MRHRGHPPPARLALDATGAPVPHVVRDRLYDLIARNRYRLFGRSETCMVPGRICQAARRRGGDPT
jgi:predicted DCC family thiol-disulfide oxidoreductase YuxK